MQSEAASRNGTPTRSGRERTMLRIHDFMDSTKKNIVVVGLVKNI